MQYLINRESFNSIAEYWRDKRSSLKWDCIFVLPYWLQSWWELFGNDDLFLLSVLDNDELIGIAPLRIKGNEAYFIGDRDVCDYLDFIVAPDKEDIFINAVIDYLRNNGITTLVLAPVKQGSFAATHLLGKTTKDCGYSITSAQEDVLVEMDLPDSWDKYLGLLSTKQRHEAKRKLNKVTRAGNINFSIHSDADVINTFLQLFRKNREDKVAFMTSKMQSFFISLTKRMAEIGVLKVGVLELDSLPVASVMCFDYDDIVYLYNSAYDDAYAYLSVGIISKIMCIKDSIEHGKKSFSFLKGAEEYKYRLGGIEVPVYNCRINL